MAEVAICIPGLPPSANTLYPSAGGRRMLSRAGQEWRQTVVDACVAARAPTLVGRRELTLLLSFVGLGHNRDLDNCIKACIDALAAALGFDDRYIDRLEVERMVFYKRLPRVQETLVLLRWDEQETPLLYDALIRDRALRPVGSRR